MKIVTVSLRHQRVSPKKMRPVLNVVRGKSVNLALDKLETIERKSARILKGLIRCGVTACKTKDYQQDELVICEAICQEGKKLKRTAVDARGRSRGFVKRASHIKLSFSKKQVPLAEKVENKQGKENGPKS